MKASNILSMKTRDRFDITAFNVKAEILAGNDEQ
mgnify:CR=1 FL=1